MVRAQELLKKNDGNVKEGIVNGRPISRPPQDLCEVPGQG
jgi:hypothetical protein